jgi:hypothetical protein
LGGSKEDLASISNTDLDWDLSVVHAYLAMDGKLADSKATGGISQVAMSVEPRHKLNRKREGKYAVGRLKNMLADAFA